MLFPLLSLLVGTSVHRTVARTKRNGIFVAIAVVLLLTAYTLAVVAGAGVAAQTSMAATTWPAQKTFTGRAFDTCTAPSLAAMKAWNTGFYGAAAVYIGGKNRGCNQPNLTPSWVKDVSALGWKLIPLYVGAQPSCQTGSSPEKLTPSTAASMGAADGADAVAKAAALGMKAGSPVYLDMESYDLTDKACNDAVLTYVRAFDKALHAKTYRTGYYGFTSSSAKAVATAPLPRRRSRHRAAGGDVRRREVGVQHVGGLALGPDRAALQPNGASRAVEDRVRVV